MEFTVKTDEESLVVMAYKVFKQSIQPKFVHDDNRVWVRSEYLLNGQLYAFDPDGSIMWVNVKYGV